MANNNRSDIEKLSEGMAIKLLLIEFAKFIKSEYTLCTDYGGIFSSELTTNNPNTEYLVNRFLKEKVGIIRR